jgi:hypothetical protein
MSHPDFAVLIVSWELALRADGYADNTVALTGLRTPTAACR